MSKFLYGIYPGPGCDARLREIEEPVPLRFKEEDGFGEVVGERVVVVGGEERGPPEHVREPRRDRKKREDAAKSVARSRVHDGGRAGRSRTRSAAPTKISMTPAATSVRASRMRGSARSQLVPIQTASARTIVAQAWSSGSATPPRTGCAPGIRRSPRARAEPRAAPPQTNTRRPISPGSVQGLRWIGPPGFHSPRAQSARDIAGRPDGLGVAQDHRSVKNSARSVAEAFAMAVVLAALAPATACRAAESTALDRCAKAKAAAVQAWDDVLPAMRSAADRARVAASNCDGPTRDEPPCDGQMSDRFLDRSLTTARLAEVERAREATAAGDLLAAREATRDVKDAPNVSAAKRAAESAYAICERGGRATP